MDILRIAALGTAGVLLGITVKGAKPEFALLVTVGAGLCILAGTVGKMQYLHALLATGDGGALLGWHDWSAGGQLYGHCKDWLDRRFVKRHRMVG